MAIKDLSILIGDMDKLFLHHCTCRSHFPYMDSSLIGTNEFPTAPYYGVNLVFQYAAGLAVTDIELVNSTGHYINQNFVIRLYALLDYYKVLSPIDKTITGNDEVDILRRLRNSFGHTPGDYNSNDPDQKKLRDRVVAHFNLSIEESDNFPLPIDTVLEPLFNACKEYVRGFYKKQKS
jgi:hypothetical protein